MRHAAIDEHRLQMRQLRRDVTPWRQVAAPDHRELGAGIIGLMAQHSCLIGFVHRHHQRADLRQAEPDQDIVDAAGEHHQHPVALDHPGGGEPAPDPIGGAVDLGIAHGRVAHQQQRLVRMPLGVVFQQVVEDDLAGFIADGHSIPARTA